ncbi:MAG: hypothetical protein HBSAPP03_19480 [Phycisphaerae bacterium]|nr:MAG: hypothetical protein HBSAPP03_19480 [Phycisphaerae bacterium]
MGIQAGGVGARYIPVGLIVHRWVEESMVRNLAGIAAMVMAIPALGQLVVGSDQSPSTIWLVDVTGASSPRALLTGTAASVSGLTADDAGQTLYWTNLTTLYKAAYQSSGALTPVLVGTFSGAATSITALAYDSTDGVLVGRGSGGFYAINTTNAVTTTIFASSAQDFGGLEYDAATNAFYAANDSTSVVLVPGRGLYRINKPLSSPTFTRLASYPSGDTDIDGLGVGGGVVYLVNDTAAQGIYRYDLSSDQYLSSLANPMTGTGTSAGGAWAPGLMGPSTSADVEVTLADAPDPVVPPGGTLQYTITVRNNGPAAAPAVQVQQSLPGGVTFLSASAPLSHAGGTVSGNLGTLAPSEERVLNVNVQTGGPANLVSVVNVSSTAGDPNAANNQAQATTTVRNVQADLRVTITDPTDCVLNVGESYSYVVTLTNLGPEGSAGASLLMFLPTNAAFLGSVPVLTPSNNTLTLPVGALAVNDAVQVEVFVQATQAGQVALSSQAIPTTEDPNLTNNFFFQPTRIATPTPTSARALGLVSTLASHPSSLVPGHGGVRYTDLGAPFSSPSGNRWVLAADTDAPTTIDAVVALGDSAGHQVVARENTFPLLPTIPANSFSPFAIDPVLAVDDAGRWAMSGIDNRPTTTDDGYVVMWNGAAYQLIAQEGGALPAMGGGVNFGSLRGGARLSDSGSVLFAASLSGGGVSPGTDQGVLALSGAWGVARKGVTIPSGQRLGNAFAYTGFDLGGNPALAAGSDATGTRFIASGTVADSANFDRVVVVDNVVVVQEGVPLPGFSSPAAGGAPVQSIRMEASGDWFVMGSNADAQDWVFRNGVVIARTDNEIIAGSGERWSQLTLPTTFLVATQSSTGSIILGGATNHPDPLRDSVIVRDGVEVLLRENDPIDLNGDGIFNEDLYIRSFVLNGTFLAADGSLVALVHVRNGDAARCVGDDLDLGVALVRIPGPAAPCDADVNCDGSANGVDVEIQELAVGGDFTDYCQVGIPGVDDGDFNRDGAVNGVDVEAVELVVGGGPCP